MKPTLAQIIQHSFFDSEIIFHARIYVGHAWSYRLGKQAGKANPYELNQFEFSTNVQETHYAKSKEALF